MTTEMSLKLIIDRKSGRVLFAEAAKNVVDFIFSFLYMPMAAIVKLLTKEHMMGSIGNIFKSAERMDEVHLECSKAKSQILSPTFTSPSKFLTGGWISATTTNGKYYKCTTAAGAKCSSYVTDKLNYSCPGCYSNSVMATELTYVSPNHERLPVEATINTRGFAKGPVAWTITDDLTLVPVCSAATLDLLKQNNIKDASMLEERRVKLGTKEVRKSYVFHILNYELNDPENVLKALLRNGPDNYYGLELLKASLKSKTVLTDVFLGKKAESK